MERKTLEQWQDEIASKVVRYPGNPRFKSFQELEKDQHVTSYLTIKVAYQALQAFHKQEIEYLQAHLPKWISLEERLPNEGERVICINIERHNTHVIDYWSDSEIAKSLFQSSGNFKYSYTHWQPLPKPPTN